jgi:hypothetical protein
MRAAVDPTNVDIELICGCIHRFYTATETHGMIQLLTLVDAFIDFDIYGCLHRYAEGFLNEHGKV